MRSNFFAGLALCFAAGCSLAQTSDSTVPSAAAQSHPKQAAAAQSPAQQQKGSASQLPPAPTPAGVPAVPKLSQQQPKRILGLMPNYRAVTAGEMPPPPTPGQAFVLATQNTFDYSSFVFVGITSLMAEGEGAHPALGKGIGGFWGYSWRGFVDKADGNYLVLYAFPTVLHEDERYYAKGQGSIWNRGIYAASRVLITPNYQGRNTFNAAEMLGRAISEGVSVTYYPSSDRTAPEVGEKFGWAVGRDALTNVFREFWPDIATHVLHRPPKS